MVQQALEKGVLHGTAPADDRVCLAGAEQLCFAAVTGHGIAFQIALLHQLVHIHGDEVRLDMPHLHDVPGRFIVRVVGEKQQDVQRRLRQAKLLTQRFADSIVRLRGLDGKFDVRVHCSSILSSLNDSFLKYYSAEEGRCQEEKRSAGGTLGQTPCALIRRCAPPAPLFVTCGDISPRPGRICPGAGEVCQRERLWQRDEVCVDCQRLSLWESCQGR